MFPKLPLEDSIGVQLVKLAPVTLASLRTAIQALNAPLPLQCPAKGLGKQQSRRDV